MCGFQTPRWQGKCPDCGEWNTLAEQTVMASKGGAFGGSIGTGKIETLQKLDFTPKARIHTGLKEVDEVLGGGLVPGMLVLLGGDPGIGKSTLALQIALYLEEADTSVLYVSGEESAYQIKLRAERLQATSNLSVLAETSLEVVLQTLMQTKPNFVVIDSIQTLVSTEVNGVVGGVSQIAFATNSLMRLAKQYHIVMVIIGHVTKEGMLAGPKTLEHMVDTVLYLEGERFQNLRVLRCQKNRYGSTGEIGVFEMRGEGLIEVGNPSALFLEHRATPVSGSCITAVLEGNKVLFVEVQALAHKTNFGNPKRAASGFDVNRLQLLLAIMQKRLGLPLADQDVYVNVAGGFKLEERVADLPVVLAIASSLYDQALPKGLVAMGEVGLSGEARSVPALERRLKEMVKLGLDAAWVGGSSSAKVSGATVKAIGQLGEALKLAFGPGRTKFQKNS
jgi:DNA repair protein RadA/Sms